MKIQIIKSYDTWEDDCGGWYDLYSVECNSVKHYIYPLSDWLDNPEVPDDLLIKFKETLNGSKIEYGEMIKAVYWDLILGSNDTDCNYDSWSENNRDYVWMEDRLISKFGVTLEVVDHSIAYKDMRNVFYGNSK